MSNKIHCFDKEFTGQIYRASSLRFEDGKVKDFKFGHNAIGGQKLIIIGTVDDYQLCLNVTSASNTEMYRQLKANNQIMELTVAQCKEIYKNPKPNTYIRLDHIILFNDIHSFLILTFRDELYKRFSEVSHLSTYNPMNLRNIEAVQTLPKCIIERFCEESKLAIAAFGVSYDKLAV